MNLYIVDKSGTTMERSKVFSLKLLLVLLPIFLCFSAMASADIVDNGIGKFNQYEVVTFLQGCANSTYSNISSVYIEGNQTFIISNETVMSQTSDNNYGYSFSNNSLMGKYRIIGHCDLDGVDTQWSTFYEIRNTSLTYLIILLALATLFFIASLVINEEIFVYLAGVLFLVAGIYTMINGIDVVNDWYSRAVSYVLLGIGILFTVGAYIYNSYEPKSEEEYD